MRIVCIKLSRFGQVVTCAMPLPEPSPPSPVQRRILVVDDHRKIREPLATLLRRAGFDVRVADGAQAMALVLRHEPIDLVLLDVMLPDGDGFALCRALRAAGGPAVILLTALGETRDRIAGLNLGADDYIVKPFEPDELVARIHGVLRRVVPPVRASEAVATQAGQPGCFAFGPWTFDEGGARLTHDDGRTVALSGTELRLLGVLVRNARAVVSRERLQELTGRPPHPGFERTIDRQISRLRCKLEADPRRPVLLRTAWGDGYLLTVAAVPLVSAS